MFLVADTFLDVPSFHEGTVGVLVSFGFTALSGSDLTEVAAFHFFSEVVGV